MAGGRCLLPRLLEIACIDVHQTGSVVAGSDHLQLIKFWRSCTPGNGSAAGRKFLAPPTTASAQCLRLSERFFIDYVTKNYSTTIECLKLLSVSVCLDMAAAKLISTPRSRVFRALD